MIYADVYQRMKVFLAFSLTLFFLIPALAQRDGDPATYLKTSKKKVSVILKAGNFKPGEHVADIGAGIGWLDAAIGIYEDSLTFYLEEIDSSTIKNSRLQEAINEFVKVRGKPFTCTYSQVMGTYKSTNLPDTLFDKVLLVDTYHHLSHRDEMIKDINRILRSGGKLIVYEPLADNPGEVFKPCNTVIYTSHEMISSFREKGFQFEGTYETVRTAGKKVKVFVFGKW